MSLVDIEDRVHLATILAAVFAVLTCGIYLDAGGGTSGALCAGAVFVAASAALVVLRMTSKTVEAMDEYASKFEQASERELAGRDEDELGPASFGPPPDDPVRQPDEAATVESLVARAHEVKDQFDEDV